MIFLSKQKDSTIDSAPMELDTIPGSTNLAGNCCFLSKTTTSKWIIDSGAMDHICNSLDSYVKIHKILGAKHNITIPDDRKVMVDVCTNVIFTNGECVLQDHSRTRVLGRLSNCLYYADIPTSIQFTFQQNTTCVATKLSTSNNTNIDLAKLWHLRLGHLSFSQLKFLLPTFDVNKFNASTFCTICPTAKQTKISFPLSSIKTTSSFQLIHVDVCGPYRHVTHDGCKFFHTIIDDFTRCT